MPSNTRVLPFTPAKTEISSAFEIPDGSAYSLLGPSAAIERVRSQIRRVAPHFRSALLTGEPGTRGEDVARALHSYSPFCAVPLMVLSATDAELRFATGASRAIEIAPSMIYLPDLEQLSRPAQEGLLQLMRVRGVRSACVVAFSGHNLRSLISTGGFSVELGSTLGSLRIALPALCERPEDMPVLIPALLSSIAAQLGLVVPKVADDFLEAAATFDWPGNFDQLEAILSELLANGAPTELRAHHLELACANGQHPSSDGPGPVRMIRLEQVVQEHIRAILMACNGNKLRTAEVLGISRSTLYRTLEAAEAAPTLPVAG